MRLKITSAFVLGFLTSFVTAAEQTSESIKANLDEIRAPEIPAFAALGVSPTEVISPTSPRAFVLSVLNDAVRDDGSIASDFAVQFSPYWWQPRDLTWDEYNDPRQHIFDVLKQSLTFSVATSSVEVEVPAATPQGATDTRNDTLVALGVSVDLIKGQPSTILRAAKQRIADVSTETAAEIGNLIAAMASNPLVIAEGLNVHAFNWDGLCPNSPKAYCREYLTKVKDIELAYRQAVAAQVDALSGERVGHSLQLSGALAYQLVDGSTDSRERANSSYWLSYKYVRETKEGASPFKFVALARYNDMEMSDMGLEEDSFDVGGRLIWESKAYPINASIEYIRRELSGDSDERLTALVDYRVNDNFTAFLSIGQNFETNVVPLLTNDDAVATIGLRINTSVAQGLLNP